MDIEVKANANRGKLKRAKEQLDDGRKRVHKVVDSIPNISDQWKFIGVIYLSDCNLSDKECCEHCENFIIKSKDGIADQMMFVESLLKNRRSAWNPTNNVKDFVELSKQIMFEAQGKANAPVTSSQIRTAISTEMDKSSNSTIQSKIAKVLERDQKLKTLRKVFFWTPEQLSIFRAINKSFMVLMGYYGCGKTLLLKERLKYLIDDEMTDIKTIHFYVKKNSLALIESLQLEFPKLKNQIKPLRFFRSNNVNHLLVEDKIEPNHHIIFDEVLIYDLPIFIENLKYLKAKVASVWIAIGGISNLIDIETIKEEISQIPLNVAVMNHCLRNTRKVFNFSKSIPGHFLTTKLLDTSLQHFSHTVAQNFANEGFFEILKVEETWIEALTKSAEKVTGKWLIMLYDEVVKIRVQEVLPQKNIRLFLDEEERKQWFSAKEYDNTYLILNCAFPAITFANDIPYTKGIEVNSMIYICPACPNCKNMTIDRSLITRAKVSLIIAPFIQECKTSCEDLANKVAAPF